MENWHEGFAVEEQWFIYFSSIVIGMLVAFVLGAIVVERLKKVALMKREEGKSFLFEIYVGLFIALVFVPLLTPTFLLAYSPVKAHLPKGDLFAGLFLFWHIILWVIIFFKIKGKEMSRLYRVAHRDMDNNPFK